MRQGSPMIIRNDFGWLWPPSITRARALARVTARSAERVAGSEPPDRPGHVM